jgi:hypothetical protein
MSIHLKQPYKIIERKQKRYEEHYHVPSDKCVVIPLKEYGDDISCNVYWEDSEGKIQQQQRLLFNSLNIEPLDSLRDFHLHEVWQHHSVTQQPERESQDDCTNNN